MSQLFIAIPLVAALAIGVTWYSKHLYAKHHPQRALWSISGTLLVLSGVTMIINTWHTG